METALERSIRAARPMSGNRNMPVTDRGMAELAALTGYANPAAAKKSPHRTPALIGAGLAIVALTATFLLPGIVRPPVSHAAISPAMLDMEPLHESATALLTQLSDVARSQPYSEVNTNQSRGTYSWLIQLDMSEDNPESSLGNVPTFEQLTRHPDGSITIDLRSVDISPGCDLLSAQALSCVQPGELINVWEYNTESGYEWTQYFSGPVPADPKLAGAFLNQSIHNIDASFDNPNRDIIAIDYFSIIYTLLVEQTLSNEQNAAILSYLATVPDIQVGGAVIDRLGRPGIAFGATSPNDPEFTEYLIISTETGDFLASENVYHGYSRKDLESPTVYRYYAWK